MNSSIFAFRGWRKLPALALLFSLFAPSMMISAQSLRSNRQIDRNSTTARTADSKGGSQDLVSSNVVISQVYGAGGNSNAAYRNDYVELFNRGASAVSLSGWSIQYTSATGPGNFSSNVTTLSGSIPAGGYYLVQLASGGSVGTTLPTADATGTINMSGTAGKVIVANLATGIACNGSSTACNATQLSQIVDLVGFGGANYFEGAGSAPAPSASNAIFRAGSGCTDTDNNNNDFSAAAAAPRNSAAPANPCGGGNPQTNPSGSGAASPTSVNAGGTSLLTVTVTPGANPASTGLTVTGDLSAIGGSASQVFFDNGTNGDTTAGDNVFSYLATVAAGTAPGAKSLGFQVSDAQSRTATGTISLTVAQPPPTGQPLPLQQNWSNINLITTNNDWSGVPGIVGYQGDNLTGSTGTDPQTITADGSSTPVSVIANQTNPNTLTSGGVAEFDTLANPTVALQGSGTADAPHIVLSVETTGKSNITVSYNLRDVDGSSDNAAQAVALQYRVGNTGAYTNVPAAFVPDASSGPDESSLVTPVNVALPAAVDNQPLVQLRIITTNAVSNDEWIGVDDIAVVADGVIPLSASGAASPSTVTQGNNTLLTVTVNPATNPASTGIAVTGDLSAIGGANNQQFFDDGTNGDVTANDNVFSYQATVPANNTTGALNVPVTVSDAQARTYNLNIGLTVIVPGGGSPHTPEEHLTMGNPSGATQDVANENNYLLPKDQYVVGYNRSRATPNWVSWHLDSSWIGGAQRQDDFRPDPSLPAGWYQVNQSSYSGSGYDRGHHTPSADRTSSNADNSATFFMTNMMPQAPGNNQGPWERLESFSRTLVGQGNELYIVAGGTGTGGTGDNGFMTTVDGGRVTVPAYTWKVILVLPVGEADVSRVNANTRAIAVIMPNDTAIRPDAWQKYLATVDQVEALTGYDFFSNVPVSIQNQIESRLDAASNTSPQTVSGGTYANLDVSDRPQVTLTGNVTVTGTLTLGPSILNTGNFRVTLAPGATVSRSSGYVNGLVEKQFGATGTFVYPVGTANGYSPLTVDITALGTAPSSLTVRAVQGAHPNAPNPNVALARYWTLDENGDLTADLTFQYLQQDVPSGGSEPSLRVNRYEGSFTELPTTLETNANTATVTNISQFSDWTLLAAFVPTAAHVSVEGRVQTTDGRGIYNALVFLTDAEGQIRTARSNPFGYYRFADLPAGQSYVLSGTHKSYTFAAQVLSVTENATDVNLTAIEP